MPRTKWLDRRRLAALLVPMLLLISPGLMAQAAVATHHDAGNPRSEGLRREVRSMIAAARDRVFPSLVHIEVVTARHQDGQEIRDRSQGSGMIVTPEGYVLTNQHVVQRGTQFRCTLADRRKVSASLVGEDPLTDLAVLKLDLSELADGSRSLPVAQFGDSEKLEIGDYVMAMGSPYSLSRSVTLGIVSNTARVLPPELMSGSEGEMELEPGQSTGLFTLWIQHDALINPGNSGGPLVDLAGNIVGINEMGGAAIGFAIPSNLARRVATDLIQHGEVPRSWIGLSFRPIADAGLSEGVLVDSVAAGSPGARAGIRTGDVILSLGGRPVTIRFPEEVPPLMGRISEEPIGSRLQIAYRRESALRETEIVTERLLRDRGEERAFPAWGFTAQEITPKMARDLGVTAGAGALVTGIRSGSPAQLAQPSLAPGDFIQAAGGSPVRSLADLAARYQEAREASPSDPVLVSFDRRGKSYLTLLKEPMDRADMPAAREVLKPWIGIATQPVLGELGEALGMNETRGYRITRVYPQTAANAADLRVGDVILAVDGEPLAPRGPEDAGLLDRKIRSLEIGQTVGLALLRDGLVQEKTVTLERNLVAPPEARQEANGELGLIAREVTFFDRDENRWGDDIGGVIVEKVEPASWAGLAGLRQRDVIQKIGRREVRDLKGYRDALAGVSAERPKRIEVVVLRGARTHMLFLEPLWELDRKTRLE